jgi:hypothetical protein
MQTISILTTCGACLRGQEIMTHVYKKGFKDTKGIIRVRTSKDNKESPQYAKLQYYEF